MRFFLRHLVDLQPVGVTSTHNDLYH